MVRKYKKALRKAKRKLRKKAIRNYTQLVIFPQNKKTLPDRLHVTLYSSLRFMSATGVGTAGAAATFNVNGMYLTNPWVSSGFGTTFIDYTAAVGGAGGGFGGTLVTGNTATAPGFFAQLMDLYSFYFTKKSSITVNVDVDSVNDEGDIAIRPLSNLQGNTTVFDNMQESRYAKRRRIDYYTNGQKYSNNLSNSIKTSTVLGYNIGDDKMTLEGGFVGNLATGPASPWNWQVMYQSRFNRATAGRLGFNVVVKYDVVLFQPQPYNT